MNPYHLLWIIPFVFLLGVGCYATLQVENDNKISNIAFCCLEKLHNISVEGACNAYSNIIQEVGE